MSFKKDMRRTRQAGYTEKEVRLPDGTLIHYAQGPSSAGPPLLLIHGQTGAWQDYAPVLPPLARDFDVYAVDCHGHGKSCKTPEKYTAARMGADLVWFIKNVIGKKALVSGHSSGGLLAAWLSANEPDCVSGVLLEDPPFFSTELGGRWETSFAYVDTYEPMHRFLNQTEEKDWVLFYLKNAAWGKFVGEKGMAKMVSYGEKRRKTHPDKPLHFFFLPDAVNGMFRFMDQYDLRFGESFYDGLWFEGFDRQDVLARIKCPVVLLHTKWSVDEDGILMAAMSGEDAQRVQQLIVNCERINVDSGHNVHVEKPEVFLQAVRLLADKI